MNAWGEWQPIGNVTATSVEVKPAKATASEKPKTEKK
jgi:hypothetical protein